MLHTLLSCRPSRPNLTPQRFVLEPAPLRHDAGAATPAGDDSQSDLLPRAPQSSAPWGERLAYCFAEPNRPVSLRPLLYATMPGGGKLGMGYGATLVGRSGAHSDAGWVTGAAVMGVSSAVVLAGVLLLGNTVAQVNPRAAPYVKLASIGGGLVMTTGYGVGGYASVHPNAHWALGVGVGAKWLGTAMMACTLPLFITHATAVLGEPPFARHRSSVGSVLHAFGLATLAVAISAASSGEVPAAATQAIAVVGTFACLVAAGIVECADPPWPYHFPAGHAAKRAAPSWVATAPNYAA